MNSKNFFSNNFPKNCIFFFNFWKWEAPFNCYTTWSFTPYYMYFVIVVNNRKSATKCNGYPRQLPLDSLTKPKFPPLFTFKFRQLQLILQAYRPFFLRVVLETGGIRIISSWTRHHILNLQGVRTSFWSDETSSRATQAKFE